MPDPRQSRTSGSAVDARLRPAAPVPEWIVVDRIVRALLASQIAPTVAGLVRARTSDPVITSIRLYCRHGGLEIPLGPPEPVPPTGSEQDEPIDEAPPLTAPRLAAPRLEKGLVPMGQPMLVRIVAKLAVQVDVQLPGEPQTRRCQGEPPWTFEFAATTAGPVRVVARNAANPAGVAAESVPLRVIPELDFSTLRFPELTRRDIDALEQAVRNSTPDEDFDPSAYVRGIGQIEQHTRAMVTAGLNDMAGLRRKVETLKIPGQQFATDYPDTNDADIPHLGDIRATLGPILPPLPWLEPPFPVVNGAPPTPLLRGGITHEQ